MGLRWLFQHVAGARERCLPETINISAHRLPVNHEEVAQRELVPRWRYDELGNVRERPPWHAQRALQLAEHPRASEDRNGRTERRVGLRNLLFVSESPNQYVLIGLTSLYSGLPGVRWPGHGPRQGFSINKHLLRRGK